MKRCPECRRDYYDDSLLYCLDDGTLLLDGPGPDNVPTAILKSDPGREAGTELFSEPLPTAQPPQNTRLGKLVRNRRVWVVISAAAIVGAVIVAWRFMPFTSGKQIASIAVLPIINTTSDPDTDYLSDGVTDNLIDRLARLPDLKVIAHNAVFQYKGKEIDPRTIGSELSVEAILMGRLVKRGDAVTISLELVNAKDNSHIWGQQYDRQMSDLLSLQREIPLDVSQKLRVRLSGETKERLTRAYTDSPAAYELYLKGRHAWETWTLDGAKQAISLYEEALKHDPDYALAYAGLADVYFWGRFAGAGLPEKEAHRLGRQYATRALSLDPELSEAHAALSEVLLWDEWDFAGAERELRRAIDLSPGNGGARHAYSHLLQYLGRDAEALDQARIFRDLDPRSEVPLGHLCYTYVYARQYDEGIQTCRKDIELFPDTPQGYTLAEAYYQTGMDRDAVDQYLKSFAQDRKPDDFIAECRKAFDRDGMRGFYRRWLEFVRAQPDVEDNAVDIADFHSRLGETDVAFEWLEKGFASRSHGMVRLKEEPGFNNLRLDPRFADLVARVGLPQ